MPLTSLEILGFRGFATLQKLEMAVPDGSTLGSGLTIIVGANNSGKSTITEAFRAIGTTQGHMQPSFAEGRRNRQTGGCLTLRLRNSDGATKTVQTTIPDGSETETIWKDGTQFAPRIFSLPSRRYFQPYFGRSMINRDVHIAQDHLPSSRSASLDTAPSRLFGIQSNRAKFDEMLSKVLNPVPE